jgi:intein/homing endonuclease
LGGWRGQVEQALRKHRDDPNFKAVMPIPVGVQRIGGDGKLLMLTPEINGLNQTIVGGMGIPLEFIMGGLNWCIAPGSNIFSDKGMLRLEEICPIDIGYEAAEDISVATKDQNNKIALVHRTEKKIPYKAKTQLGLELTGSKIHKLWCLNPDMTMSWKNMEDIKKGDYVAVSRGDNVWGTKKAGEHLSRLLGYLVSEGSVSETRMTFSNTNPEVVEDFKICFKKVFGHDISFHLREFEEDSNHFGMQPIYETDSRNKKVVGFLREIGLTNDAFLKDVPLVIRQSGAQDVFSFLSALFEGDGCNSISNNKQTISYASVSKKLLEDVQLLLLNAGIVSYKYDSYVCEDGQETTPCLQIRSEQVIEFLKTIGFITKNNKNNSTCNPQGFRSDFEKIPYLKENLEAIKNKTSGRAGWVKDSKPIVLEQDSYSAKEFAGIIGRDASSVTLYIKKGQLKAVRGKAEKGRFAPWIIKKEDAELFLSEVGVKKNLTLAVPAWEINSNNVEAINWSTVAELDPVLAERSQEVLSSRFVWSRVTDTSVGEEPIEMCDLTVFETHSYIANGFVSHNTGSSVSLRTLENDFIQNRTELLDLVLWIKEKLRGWFDLPNLRDLRFIDFRMADDVQKNQQLIGLNAANKVSDQTMLTELGYDWKEEQQKLMEEIYFQNALNELRAKGGARIQGEASLVQFGYDQKVQDIARKAQEAAQKKVLDFNFGKPNSIEMNKETVDQADPEGQQNMPGGEMQNAGEEAMEAATPPDEQAEPEMVTGQDSVDSRVERMAAALTRMPTPDAQTALNDIMRKFPELGMEISRRYKELLQGLDDQQDAAMQTPQAPQQGAVDMKPLPEKAAPRRQGAV